MSEAMTVETILEADWRLQGFWTRMRVPYPAEKGGYSDIDLLAYHPLHKHLVIGESKADGGKDDVWAYTESASSVDADFNKLMEYPYFAFTKNLKRIYQAQTLFSGDCQLTDLVKVLTVQVVTNLFVAPEVAEKVAVLFAARIHSDLNLTSDTQVNVQIETAIDVFARIIEGVGKSPLGKRYGHPVLDLAREFHRYSQGKIWPAMRGSLTKENRESVESRVTASLLEALTRRATSKG